LCTLHRVALLLELLVLLAELDAQPSQFHGILNANHELSRPNRLGQEVVPANAERAVERIQVTRSRKKEDWRFGPVRQGPDPLADSEAVQVRHTDIEQDTVRPSPLECGDSIHAS
jgi:hypothetical protein